MQSTQKLSRSLKALLELIEEEAKQNPIFASRLDAITAELPKTVKKNSKAISKVEVPDVMTVIQEKGEEEFRFWLRNFDVAMLKAIVKANGFDSAKISQRWNDPDKFIILITEQTIARLKRGSAFLPQKAT